VGGIRQGGKRISVKFKRDTKMLGTPLEVETLR
jgi:hypothetical protein